MGWGSCSDLYAHEGVSIFLGLWSGISGIVALTLNDMSQCDASYQTLMVIAVLGIGLAVFSVFYFITCFIPKGWKEACFPWLVSTSAIFVFLLDCMLINYHVRGNDSLL
jgi:hypothetical protein